ncbi:hypothetical protein FGRMN_4286 [Fusarium graminum]|nr:hypothetical protein FGRMN_4286 [Fusarium graminum]
MASLLPRVSRISMPGPMLGLCLRPSFTRASLVPNQPRFLHATPFDLPASSPTRLTSQRPTFARASTIQHQTRTVVFTRPSSDTTSGELTTREKVDDIHQLVPRLHQYLQEVESFKSDITTINQMTSELVALEKESFHDRVWREAARHRASHLTEEHPRADFTRPGKPVPLN